MYGRVVRPVLGITLAPPQAVRQLGQEGVLAYAAAPPVGGQPRDFVYRTITFGGAPALAPSPSPVAVDFSWVRGVNYVPSYSHNDVATFQDYSAAVVEQELAWAAQSGFNAVRTFLSSLPWLYDAAAFTANLAHFVRTLERNNLTSQLVLFDSCFGDVNANVSWISSGLYKNATWIPNPGPAKIVDAAAWPALEAYVAAVVRVVGASRAVLLWDVHNEPDFNVPNMGAFIAHMAGVVARLDHSRPTTAGASPTRASRAACRAWCPRCPSTATMAGLAGAPCAQPLTSSRRSRRAWARGCCSQSA